MRKRTWKKGMQKALAITMVASMLVPQSLLYAAEDSGTDTKNVTSLTDEDIEELGGKVTLDRQGVHDPSIVVNNGKYYVFGSHMAVATSDDLMDWATLPINGENENNAYFGTRDDEGKVTKVSYLQAFLEGAYGQKEIEIGTEKTKVTVDFSTFPASEWNTAISSNPDDSGNTSEWKITGNLWAPDVIYNDTMKKWCMYLSLNGNVWNSVVILLTADDIEGPYVYEAPIVYSGFTASGVTSYTKTDLSLVLNNGTALDSLPARYDNHITGVSADGKSTSSAHGTYGDYWPHAIDPTVYYDDDNNLWLLYGSWSGGIYTIELDEKTGLRDYTVTYPYEINGASADETTKSKNVTSDPYFGTKIAGGCYVSGEGAYVEKIGNYFYLFVSYGFYSPTGGYTMRVFRSENPDGPFVDANDQSAIYYDSWMDNYRTDSKGVQLMGNYKWDTMNLGEIAQGHNSAFVDEDGNAYVIYHTKFDDDTAAHNVRVHQLYTNEKGWLVAAPYEYAGETINDADISKTEISKSDIVGEYELIMHQYTNTKAGDGLVADCVDVITPVTINLNDDGTITGAVTGTWVEKAGTAYATITISGTTYYGVFAEQCMDNTSIKVMCFTATSDTGRTIWGSKAMNDQQIIAYNTAFENVKIPTTTKSDIALSTESEYGATIKWSSSDTSVITDAGVVTQCISDRKVTLTKTITSGDYSYDKKYEVVVLGTCTGADDPILSYDSLESGDTIAPAEGISSSTGVSISFTVSSITSDWTPVLITEDGNKVYLSVLNYSGADAFEAAGTMSSVAAEKYVWPHTIFTDGATYKVTISYNTDGTIAFYRDDVLMLTYAANTAIGSKKVSDLAKAMAEAAAAGEVIVQYNMTDVTVDVAKDYEKTDTGHTYSVSYNSTLNSVGVKCSKCSYNGIAELSGGTVSSTYKPTLVDGVISLPTATEITKDGEYEFVGWKNLFDGTVVTSLKIEDIFYGGDLIRLEAQWKEIGSEEEEDDEQNNTGIPSIGGADDKTGWDAIQTEIKDKTSDSEKLQEVVVNMNGATEVPKSIIEAIKGKNIDLKIQMKTGITWVFNGESVTKTDLDKIDMSVALDTNNIPKAALETVTKDKPSRTLTLTHDGEFGFTAKLTVNVGTSNAAKKAILYYYNESTGKMEPSEANIVTAKGDVTFVFLHASEYVIVFEDVNTENLGDGAPGTGDNTNVVGHVWLMVLSVATIYGVTVVTKTKKKARR